MKHRQTVQYAGWLMATGFWDQLAGRAINTMRSASNDYFDQAAWDAAEDLRDEFFHEWDDGDLPFEQTFLDGVDEERVVRELINVGEYECVAAANDLDHEFIAQAKKWSERFKTLSREELENKEAVKKILNKVWVRKFYQQVKTNGLWKSKIVMDHAELLTA